MQRRALIKAVGEAIYGARWQMPLAKDLGIGLATLKRWAGGVSGVPDDLTDRLVDVVNLNISRKQKDVRRLRTLALDLVKRRRK